MSTKRYTWDEVEELRRRLGGFSFRGQFSGAHLRVVVVVGLTSAQIEHGVADEYEATGDVVHASDVWGAALSAALHATWEEEDPPDPRDEDEERYRNRQSDWTWVNQRSQNEALRIALNKRGLVSGDWAEIAHGNPVLRDSIESEIGEVFDEAGNAIGRDARPEGRRGA